MTIDRPSKTRVLVSAERRILEHFGDLLSKVADIRDRPGAISIRENHKQTYIRIQTDTVSRADRYEQLAETVRRIERDA
jgi:hypothetical protein